MVSKIKTLFIIALVVVLGIGLYKVDRQKERIASLDAAIDSVNKIARQTPDTIHKKDTIHHRDSVIKKVTDTLSPVKDTQGVKIYRDSIIQDRFKIYQESWIDGTMVQNSLIYRKNFSIRDTVRINNKVGVVINKDKRIQKPAIFFNGSLVNSTVESHLQTGYEAGLSYYDGDHFQYSLNFGRFCGHNYLELGISYKIFSL